MNQHNLYQDILLDHYKNPRNSGRLEKADLESSAHNPSCGDSVSLQALVNNNLIIRAAFTGTGCVISQATASLTTVFITGKNITEVEKITAQDILTLLGIELGPMRARCALLSLEALREAVTLYKKNSIKS